MRQIITILILILGFKPGLIGQTFNQDSVFKMVIEKVPVALRANFKAHYDSASIQDREFILFMLSMTISSKAE